MNYLLLRHLFRMSPAMGYLKALCLIPSVRFAIRMCYPKMTYSVCLIYSRAFHNSKNRIHWLKSTPRSVAYPVSLPSQMDSPTSARESFTSPSQRHEAQRTLGSSLFKQVYLHARHNNARRRRVPLAELPDDERSQLARMRDDKPDTIMTFDCGFE